MSIRFRPILLLTFALLAGSPALAAPPTDCSTPRNAVDSLFGWLRPGSNQPAEAARCLERSGRTSEELQRLAKQAKELFDARGHRVLVDRLPDSADYADPQTGEARVVVHERLPDVVVERQGDGQWRWTRASLDQVEELHAETFSAVGERLMRNMPEWLRGAVFGVELWQYLALLLVFLVGFVLRKVIQFIVTNRMQSVAHRLGSRWVALLANAVAAPLSTLVMAGVVWVSYPQLRLPIGAALAVAVSVRVLATISFVWAAYRLVDVFSEAMSIRASRTESKLDDQLVPLVRRSLKVVTVIIGALFVLQNLDVDVGSLLAGLGIGGLAFALAAKDTLANFFGSIMIFADRPFQIGDWVVISGAEGIVEEVGFRSTRIRTFYNSVITLPNSKIADAQVDNYGARIYRRTYVTVRLSYDTTPEQMQSFVEGVRAIIRANEYSRKDYYEIHFSGFGEHSLDVMLYFFFKVSNWSEELRERHNVYLEVLRLAKELGVRFAIPTQRLHHEFVAAPGQPREVPTPPSFEQLQQIVRSFGPGGEMAQPAPKLVAGGVYAGKDIPPLEGAKKAG